MSKREMFKKIYGTCRNIRKNLMIRANMRIFSEKYGARKEIPRETDFLPEVLIPCYNHGSFLHKALSSLPQGIPVTVIDDASTDDSKSIAEKLQKNFRFKLLCNESNLNQSGSLNRAVAESDNNLFMVLNADDCYLKFCVSTLLSIFETHPSVRMAGGSCIPFSDDRVLSFNEHMPDSLAYIPAIKIFGPREARQYKALNDINMTMSGCAFLKSAWQAVGGLWDFNRRVCSYDDRDFQMRVSALFDVAVMEEPLVFYRTDSSTGRAEHV